LAAGCWDNTVVLFDSQKRVVRWVNDRQHGPVFGLAFSPDGQRLAAASLDKSIWVLDVATGRVLAPVLHTATEPFTLGYSPAGDLLAAGAIGQVVVWDVVTGG
jgi:WD40 repeat protein